eukprot:m.112794 g.112794  ORF g.112794 m.112794 type:complete len:132 (-) comp14103_c1_seq2:44-439(-)
MLDLCFRRPNVNDLILCDEEGHVLEGGQTNFFAIVNGKVYTANEGILHGTIRDTVIKICEQDGIAYVLEPPSINDIDTWEGAFLTSTSRLVLPINEVVLSDSESIKIPLSEITNNLRKKVVASLLEHSKSL